MNKIIILSVIRIDHIEKPTSKCLVLGSPHVQQSPTRRTFIKQIYKKNMKHKMSIAVVTGDPCWILVGHGWFWCCQNYHSPSPMHLELS